MLLALLGCHLGSSTASEPLTVFAAASLTDAVAELESRFEAAHPGIDVRTSFAGSQTLRLQIEQGAPADVFLSADRSHMDALASAGHIEQRTVFARSRLALIVPTDNPAGITELADLTRAERIVVGASEVPIGGYTEDLLDRLGADFAAAVQARVVSREHSVRLARLRVQQGDADAAIVYQTDIHAAGITPVALPDALSPVVDYHLGTTTGSSTHAALWADFVTGASGCTVLVAHGFKVESCDG